MILFEEDWLRYPGAIPDFNTKNTSFLVFAKTLQAMGVKNCLFFLALHDQSLVGVDPRDPNLTETQIAKIRIELEINPWYYLREFLRFPVDGVPEGTPVRANRGIIAQWWCYYNNLDIFMMQPRQTGKSAGMDGAHSRDLRFGNTGARKLILTKDRGLIAKNVKKIKDILNLFPKWAYIPNRKDKDVEYMLNYTHEDNQITFICAQNDKDKAKNASRGHTITRFHGDELPFIKYVQHMIPSISSSMDEAIRTAILNNVGYGRVYTTTAGDLSLPHGKYAYDLYIDSYPFSEELYDMPNNEKLRETVMLATGLPVARVSITYNHRQLGISDEEFYKRIQSVKSTDAEINADYFLIWGTGGVASVVPPVVLDAMSHSSQIPEYIQVTEFGPAIKWWIEMDKIDQYLRENKCVMGIDTSNQIGRDRTAFILVNVYNLEIVMSMEVVNANIPLTAQWFAEFLVKHKNVTAIIENKSSAQTFIDTAVMLLTNAGEQPMRRIFNRVVDEPKNNMELYAKVSRNYRISQEELNQSRRWYGFNTGSNSRFFLYSKVLQNACSQSRHVMRDAAITNQVALLKRDEETGRVDHASQGNDDRVIAWLLVHWMLNYGKNLDVYGIDSRRVMVGIQQDGSTMSEADMALNKAIEEAQEEAEVLILKINNAKHVGIRMMYQHELNELNAFLKEHGVEPKTLDAVINKIKEEKRFKQQTNSGGYYG